jgi:hypothetical protein
MMPYPSPELPYRRALGRVIVICYGCAGSRTDPRGGPCRRCGGSGIDPNP